MIGLKPIARNGVPVGVREGLPKVFSYSVVRNSKLTSSTTVTKLIDHALKFLFAGPVDFGFLGPGIEYLDVTC